MGKDSQEVELCVLQNSRKKAKKKTKKKDLFETDVEALIWFITPTEFWWGNSPLEVCMLNESHQVIKFLKERSGKK